LRVSASRWDAEVERALGIIGSAATAIMR
jgi:hypothetical protein